MERESGSLIACPCVLSCILSRKREAPCHDNKEAPRCPCLSRSFFACLLAFICLRVSVLRKQISATVVKHQAKIGTDALKYWTADKMQS